MKGAKRLRVRQRSCRLSSIREVTAVAGDTAFHDAFDATAGTTIFISLQLNPRTFANQRPHRVGRRMERTESAGHLLMI